MKKYIRYVLVLWVCIQVGCTDDKIPVNNDPRGRFVGTWQMTKLENGQTYLMIIDTMGNNHLNGDSISILNFGDNFNLKFQFIPTNDSNEIYYNTYTEITDKNGMRWDLYPNGLPSSPYYCNAVWGGDSIKIQFKLSNYYYYQEDGVPLVFDTIITHVGVK